MKTTNIIYWTTTILFGGFMLFTAIPNVLVDENSVNLISTMLGYPEYMIPFLGVAKTLGSLAIIIPGFPRIKEWAYAGLFFDVVGAGYSAICVEGIQPPHLTFVIILVVGAVSYHYHHKRLKKA